MKIGFDWGGVLDVHGEKLSQVATALKDAGHEVYIVSAINAGEEERRTQQVETLMPGVCTEIITLVAEWALQPHEKLVIIKDKEIEMFFDDRQDICSLLQVNGILAFQVPRLGWV